MAKTFTLTEVAEALLVDPKSLRRWIDIEKWDLTNQTTVYDKRIKYLTEDQLKHLAKVHERAWPPIVRPASEQQAAQGIAGAVGVLKGKVAELEASHVDADQYATTIKGLEEHIRQLEGKYATALERLTDALLAIKRLQDWQASQEVKPKTARKPKTSDDQADDQAEASDLEPGLVGAAAFADAHNINPTTAKSAWQSGRVPTIKGHWRVAGVRGPIQIALDEAGRARFYELYHGHDGFTACPDCPHH